MSTPIISAFNDGYVAGLYESFLRDPASVDESWRQFFQFAHSLSGIQPQITTAGAAAGVTASAAAVGAAAAVATTGLAGATADPAFLRKVAGAAALAQAVRHYGHFDVQLDPLGSPPLSAAELKPEFHGITETDLATIPGAALGFEQDATAADAVARLRQL
ncbi:MAG: 2-oxoglutarate dehydrogenase E1 subunit family protein, partial [Gemmatimonadaceae bacterium]